MRSCALSEPHDQGFVPNEVVWKAPLFYWSAMALNHNLQTLGTDINAAIQWCFDRYDSLAHKRPRALRCRLGFRPCPLSGRTLPADLEHAGLTASDSPRRNKRGTAADLCDRLWMTLASGGYGLSAEAQSIVTPRFATYKVGGKSRKRLEPGEEASVPLYQRLMPSSPFDGLNDTDRCTRTPLVARLKKQAVVSRDEVVGSTAKTFNAGWGLR